VLQVVCVRVHLDVYTYDNFMRACTCTQQRWKKDNGSTCVKCGSCKKRVSIVFLDVKGSIVLPTAGTVEGMELSPAMVTTQVRLMKR
jgi:hypothetical protein